MKLINYYYNKVPNVNYSEIKRKVNSFMYLQDELSAEEKVKLEELISLRILYVLERHRKRFFEADIDDVYQPAPASHCTLVHALRPRRKGGVDLTIDVRFQGCA